MTLRAAQPADADRLSQIADAAYGHYVERIGGKPRPMEDDYAELIATKEVVVAERDGEVVGMVVLDTDDEGFLVDNLGVDPPHQGTGVGRELLEHSEARAREEGHDSVYLYTHRLMTENLELYETIGYSEYDRREVGGGHVLVFMRKPLG